MLFRSQDIIDEVSLSPAEKKAKAAEKASKAWHDFQKIPVSKPQPKPGDTHAPITDSASTTLQNSNTPINSFPEVQKDAIQQYKYSPHFNEFLRSFGAADASKHSIDIVTNIQKSMRPMPKPVLLYRNVNTLFDKSFKPTVAELNAQRDRKSVV